MKKTEKKINSSEKAESTKTETRKKTKEFFVLTKWFKQNKVMAIGLFVVMVAFVSGYYLKSWVIAATVNGKPIWRLYVVRQLEQYQGASLLSSIVDQELIKQDAKEKGLEATKEELGAKIKEVEDSVIAQGNSLDDLLKAQGMTRKDLEENLSMNLIIEKILLSQIILTDDEVQSYIDNNKSSFPEDNGMELNMSLAKQQLQQEKMVSQYQVWLQSLRDTADIKILADY